jgi:hypothetical protein
MLPFLAAVAVEVILLLAGLTPVIASLNARLALLGSLNVCCMETAGRQQRLGSEEAFREHCAP